MATKNKKNLCLCFVRNTEKDYFQIFNMKDSNKGLNS